MLKDHASSAVVAVADVERAKRFYRDVLGLTLLDDGMDGPMTFRTGSTHLVVYPSKEAGTNRANAVVWGLGEALESVVEALRAKDVKFERYYMDGATFENGIHRFGDFRAVWFKDPDGNILHLNSAS